MPAVTFDTLKFANQLKAAGVPVTHAEAEAKALSEVFEINLGELATKEDLHHEIDGLRHEVKELETGLRHEMSDLRKDMDAKFAGIDTKFEKTESTLRQEISSSAAALRQEISGSSAAIRQELADTRFELLKWIIGLAIAQGGLLIAILKFLP